MLAVFLCDPVCQQPFSQRRELGRKGGGGGGGGEEKARGEGQSRYPALLDFPPVLEGTCHSSRPHPTSLWPVSLGGQILFAIEKKESPRSRAVFTPFSLWQAVRAVGRGATVRLLLFGANEKVALGTVASRECALHPRAWRASQAKMVGFMRK